jgi:hypothetical protein
MDATIQKRKRINSCFFCRYALVPAKGTGRCYYNLHEREVTTLFLEEDHTIILFQSLFRQKKSLCNIQVIEDYELYGIRYEDILHLLETHSEATHIRTIIADRHSNLKDIRIRAISGHCQGTVPLFEKHFPQLA